MRFDGEAVSVDAGEDWDPFVATVLEEGLGGLEPSSGIRGSVGATPILNVGAYGALVSHFPTSVTVYDRRAGATRVIPTADCGFGSHRQSIFKNCDRYVVLRVHFTRAAHHELAPNRLRRPRRPARGQCQ